jgi:deazaflavin-dependent oxidoreductase (nitroreductase family)
MTAARGARVGRWLVVFVGGALVVATILFVVMLLGMRTKSGPVLGLVRRFNRAVTNRRVLRSAGAPGAPASIIRHVGRSSGRPYETPVGPFQIGDDFVIALPYGPSTDWVRNVFAAGSATLIHEGRTVRVHDPEVVPTSVVVHDLPASQRRVLRVFGVDQCLRLRSTH